MAPHAALAEIGVPYELVVAERDDPDYRAVNPAGLVPALEDDRLVLTEAAAILLHLADRYPEVRLAPPVGSDARSELYVALIHLTNTLQPALMRVIYPERYGTTGVREAAAAEAQELFERLDARLADRAWLVGEERSAADLLLFTLTRFGRHLDPAAWDHPYLRAHFLRTLALSGVCRMVAEQRLELPGFAR
jgi:glutathione S-transferase